MSKKKIPFEVLELQEKIDDLNKIIESKNNYITKAKKSKENEFLLSDTYVEMASEIKFYKALYESECYARKFDAARMSVMSEKQKMAIEDADKILKNKTNDTFFVGITKTWQDANERSKTIQKMKALEAKNLMLEKQLADMTKYNKDLTLENEILKHQVKKAKEELYESTLEQQIIQMYNTCHSMNDVSEKLNIDISIVYKIIKNK